MNPERGTGLGEWTGALVSAAAGLIGIVTGVAIHGAKIDEIKERLDRIEDKLDRVVERRTWPDDDAR